MDLDKTQKHLEKVKAAFSKEIEKGTYSIDSVHGNIPLRFFEKTLKETIKSISLNTKTLRILDCGMGPGDLLVHIVENWPTLRPAENLGLEVSGFEFTEKFVPIAKKKLTDFLSKTKCNYTESNFEMKTGNILDIQENKKFDISYCYDVIQQLPKGDRLNAIGQMLAVSSNVIVFEKHLWSPKGIRRELKAFVTRFTPFKLVPDFYRLASYSNLYKLAAQVRRQWPDVSCKVTHDSSKRRYALVVKKQGL